MARRSGLTLAELVNQLVTGADAAPDRAPAKARKAPAQAKARKAPTKAAPPPVPAKPPRRLGTLPLPGVEPPAPPGLAELIARIEAVERRSPLDEARERQNGADRRLERLEALEAARLEASQALEEVIGAVAAQICEAEGRAELHALQTREGIRALRRRLESVEAQPALGAPPVEADLTRLKARIDELESAEPPQAASSIDTALASLTRRVEEGEQHTLTALRTLEGALAGLEAFVRGAAIPASAAERVPVATPSRDVVEPNETVFADLPAVAPDTVAPDTVASNTGAPDTAASDPQAPDPATEDFEAAVRDLSIEWAARERRATTALDRRSDDLKLPAPSLDLHGDEGEPAAPAQKAETGAESLDELGEQLRRVIVAFETADELAAEDDPAEPARPASDGPTPGLAPPAVSGMGVMDMLCMALPSASASTLEDFDRIDVLNAAQAQPHLQAPDEEPSAIEALEAPPSQTERAASRPAPTPEVREPAPPGESLEGQHALEGVRRRRPTPIQGSPSSSGAEPVASPPEAVAEPAPPVADRLTAVETFLAEQLTPLTAPRAFAPDVIEEPAPRTGANRELIESARNAARESADNKRRFPLDALTPRSAEPTSSDGGEVLDLRNGFGLLRRRNQRAG